jgi:hypothetical protein
MLARHAVLLTSPKSPHPSELLSRQQSTPVNPLAATLMDLPASVANKRLTAGLSPLNATLTKNGGEGALSTSQRLSHISIFRTLFQVPYPVSPLLATLTKTAGVCTNNSHSGARSSSLATALKFFLFTLLRTLLHAAKTQLFCFQSFPNSFPKKHPGWGVPLFSARTAREKLLRQDLSQPYSLTSLHPYFITSLLSRNGDALPAAMGAAAKRACRLQERRSCVLT